MTVQVEAARVPDRDRLLEELREAGFDARPVGEVGIEVPYEGEPDETADRLYAHAATVIMSIGAPFVPIKHQGVIYIRAAPLVRAGGRSRARMRLPSGS